MADGFITVRFERELAPHTHHTIERIARKFQTIDKRKPPYDKATTRLRDALQETLGAARYLVTEGDNHVAIHTVYMPRKDTLWIAKSKTVGPRFAVLTDGIEI